MSWNNKEEIQHCVCIYISWNTD